MRKTFLALTFALFSPLALATGGFECTSNDGSVAVYGTTGSVHGNPIIAGAIVENGVETRFSRGEVVGYWNMGSTLKMMVIDPKATFVVFTLKTKDPTPYNPQGITYGTLTRPNQDVAQVKCLY